MKPRTWLPLLMVLLLSACGREDEPLTTDQQFEIANITAKNRLGVSLGALSVLAAWEPLSFSHKKALEITPGMVWIRELERAGYIRVHETQGLPDGSNPDVTMVTLEPIGRGMEIVEAFKTSL